jgi:hypothetical protein
MQSGVEYDMFIICFYVALSNSPELCRVRSSYIGYTPKVVPVYIASLL